MSATARDLYLDLMKNALSFSLWPEPPLPADTFNYQRNPLARPIVSGLARLLRLRHMDLVEHRRISDEDRETGKIWPGYADTMIGRKRLENLQQCVETALADGIPGDLIETGVWRGGACIFMRAILAAHEVTDRRVFVADSFAGLPEPDEDRYEADRGDTHHTHPFLAVSREQVENNFRRYGLLDDQVVFLQGWFKDTLPSAPIERLAVVRLDGDMYESTMDGLTNLYPKLSPGGFCIIDDYALPGCEKAVRDYCDEHRIRPDLKEIDWTGRFWRKD